MEPTQRFEKFVQSDGSKAPMPADAGKAAVAENTAENEQEAETVAVG